MMTAVRKTAFYFGMLSFFWPAMAAADQGQISSLSVNGDLGLGNLGGAALSVVHAGVDLREGQLALGLFARVRFVLADTAETTGAVRDRDWDEVSDFLHLLNYLHYQRQLGQVRLDVQAGELLGYTLGHGTLVRAYSNVADPDHLQAGARIQLTHGYADFSAMIDNFIRPKVIAARLGLRPIPALDRLTFGMSGVVDPAAPVAIRTDAEGLRMVDRAWNLASDSETLGLMGFDVEYRIGDQARTVFTPYLDLNTSFHGSGLHLGANASTVLGASGFKLLGQLEYHGSTAGYVPAQVQTFYDLERLQSSLSFANPETASGFELSPMLANMQRGIYGGHGLHSQVGLDYLRYAALRVGYTQRPGPDGRLFFTRVSAKPITPVDLGALLMVRGLGRDDGSNGIGAIGEARYRITPYLYALAQYARTWMLSATSRTYEPFSAFNIGIGGMWNG